MTNDKYFMFQKQHELNNQIYKKKLQRLQRRFKNLVYENAALCDQVAQIQENILCVKEERRFLLKKLIEHENEIDCNTQPPSLSLITTTSSTTQSSDLNSANNSNLLIKKQIKKRSISEANSEASGKSRQGNVINKKIKIPHYQNNISNNKKPVVVTPPATLTTPEATPYQTIPLDTEGKPVLPLNMTGYILHSLGEIYDRPGYHTENLIYPVGYISTRVYSHYKDAEKKCMYTCKILDNGDQPKFEIIPECDPNFIISGPSADYCHRILLQKINSVTDMRNINIRSQGDWFFGLADPIIINLIQNSVNARNCVNYKGFTNEEQQYHQDIENNPSLNYDALQKHIAIAAYHTVPEIKEEPPDDLLCY